MIRKVISFIRFNGYLNPSKISTPIITLAKNIIFFIITPSSKVALVKDYAVTQQIKLKNSQIVKYLNMIKNEKKSYYDKMK